MNLISYTRRLFRNFKARIGDRLITQVIRNYSSMCNSVSYARTYRESFKQPDDPAALPPNPLQEHFQNHRDGHGIWKWEHYFDIYHRHFAKFVGRKVDVLEIGVYSGGSLEMWRSYFGEKSRIYGVDIQDVCREYENDHVSIFIGDQEDRAFWRNFKEKVEGIDILIDDGGHTPEQQRITLEEMLPHLRPGGVYLCEDVLDLPRRFNEFTTFASTLVHELNEANYVPRSAVLSTNVSQFQSAVHSIHFYPYVVVIEKNYVAPLKLSAPRHGTVWQPFLGRVS